MKKIRSNGLDDNRAKWHFPMDTQRVSRVSAMIWFSVLALFIVLPGSSKIRKIRDHPAYKVIAAERLLVKAKADHSMILIDCRPEDEYRAGHIPHARNVSMDSFSFGRETPVRKSIEDIWSQLGKKPAFILIDTQSGEEYMPLSKLMELIAYLPADRNDEIIFTCRRPDCTRSPMAIRWAEALGYKNVWRYEGGWQEWSEKHYPIEK